MKRNLLLFVFATLLLSAPAFAEWDAVVVDVFDGDTLIVSIDGRAEIIRLFGIDCPERQQDFGLKAKEFTRNMVAGKTVRVVTRGQARYPLCKVYVGEKCLNEELLKSGYAWQYSRYSSDEKWAKMEQSARSARKGIWSKENPTAPWDFRMTESRHTIERVHSIKLQTRHRTGTVRGIGPTRRGRTRRR